MTSVRLIVTIAAMQMILAGGIMAGGSMRWDDVRVRLQKEDPEFLTLVERFLTSGALEMRSALGMTRAATRPSKESKSAHGCRRMSFWRSREAARACTLFTSHSPRARSKDIY